MTHLDARINEDSRLSDLVALFETYAIEFYAAGLPLLSQPLHACFQGTLFGVAGAGGGQTRLKTLSARTGESTPSVLSDDPAPDRVSLVELSRFAGARRRPRWPFFVDGPLTLIVTLSRSSIETGNQQLFEITGCWRVSFEPGFSYGALDMPVGSPFDWS